MCDCKADLTKKQVLDKIYGLAEPIPPNVLHHSDWMTLTALLRSMKPSALADETWAHVNIPYLATLLYVSWKFFHKWLVQGSGYYVGRLLGTSMHLHSNNTNTQEVIRAEFASLLPVKFLLHMCEMVPHKMALLLQQPSAFQPVADPVACAEEYLFTKTLQLSGLALAGNSCHSLLKEGNTGCVYDNDDLAGAIFEFESSVPVVVSPDNWMPWTWFLLGGECRLSNAQLILGRCSLIDTASLSTSLGRVSTKIGGLCLSCSAVTMKVRVHAMLVPKLLDLYARLQPDMPESGKLHFPESYRQADEYKEDTGTKKQLREYLGGILTKQRQATMVVDMARMPTFQNDVKLRPSQAKNLHLLLEKEKTNNPYLANLLYADSKGDPGHVIQIAVDCHRSIRLVDSSELAWVQRRRVSILASPVGSGKTIMGLGLCLQSASPEQSCAVVVPSSLTQHWVDEVRKTTDFRVVSLSKVDDVTDPDNEPAPRSLYVISSHLLSYKTVQTFLLGIEFARILVDEAHKCVNSNTKAATVLNELRCPIFTAITATPEANPSAVVAACGLLDLMSKANKTSSSLLHRLIRYSTVGIPLSKSEYKHGGFQVQEKIVYTKPSKEEQKFWDQVATNVLVTKSVAGLEDSAIRTLFEQLRVASFGGAVDPDAVINRLVKLVAPVTMEGNGSDPKVPHGNKCPKPTFYEKDSTCAVCWEDDLKDSDFRQLPCGHVFCKECCRRLIRALKPCPFCRAKTKPNVWYIPDFALVTEESTEAVKGVPIKAIAFASKAQALEQELKACLGRDSATVKYMVSIIDRPKIRQAYASLLRKLGLTFHEAGFRNQSSKQTQAEVKQFRASTTAKVLLANTPGITGFNIPEVTHVFILDPDPNSANDIQGIGRMKRQNQEASVLRVTRIVYPNGFDDFVARTSPYVDHIKPNKTGLALLLYSLKSIRKEGKFAYWRRITDLLKQVRREEPKAQVQAKGFALRLGASVVVNPVRWMVTVREHLHNPKSNRRTYHMDNAVTYVRRSIDSHQEDIAYQLKEREKKQRVAKALEFLKEKEQIEFDLLTRKRQLDEREEALNSQPPLKRAKLKRTVSF